MNRLSLSLSLLILALFGHVIIYDLHDSLAKRWIVKGTLGQLGYEQLDHDMSASNPHGFARNTTRIHIGSLRFDLPLSLASLVWFQVTLPLWMACLALMWRKHKPSAKRKPNGIIGTPAQPGGLTEIGQG